MLNLFLQSAGSNVSGTAAMAFFFAFFAFFLFLLVGLYILSSLIFFSLAKKAGQDTPGLAWVPFVGPLIISFKSSGMHWWPWLLLIGSPIPFLGFITTIAFMVVSIIWMWKLFEAVDRPGWWAILFLVPMVGIIMLILAAWTDVGLEK